MNSHLPTSPVKSLLAPLFILGLLSSARALDDAPKPIAPEEFGALFKMFKAQPGENRFREIPWLLDIWEARRKAAAEGKPLLVWSGAGGPPIGVC